MLTNLVAYRGPDGAGFLGINSANRDIDQSNFNIFLGHRRLSIIDLSESSNQPMTIDGYTIIFNGEIFNYIELRRELKRKGEVFLTNSDTEVIIKIYKIYGEKGFTQLNGMWAFIIVDLENQRIVISRDRFSIKPLFYHKQNENFYFASEIKQLLPLITGLQVDLEMLNLFLLNGISDHTERTFFKDILRVLPRTNIIINLDNKKLSYEKYWEFNREEINEKNISTQFMYLMEDSIKIRLRSDVKVGSLLSGGLDSSLITSLSNKLTGKDIDSYSVVSDSVEASEEFFVDLLVSSQKISNKKLSFQYHDVIKNIESVIQFQDEPFGSLSIIAQFLLYELIQTKSDLKVVLSGQGSDELYFGYLRHYFFYLKNLKQNKRYLDLFINIYYSLIKRTTISQFAIRSAKNYSTSLLNTGKSFLQNKYKFDYGYNTNDFHDIHVKDIENYSIPILARYEDRNSMAHSIESRVPFLDHRLVEFSINLPIQYKIKNGWNKNILRESFEELPAEIRWRKDKKGFTVPESQWLKVELKDYIENVFKNSLLEELGCINKKSFLNYYASFLGGSRFIHHFDISRILIAELWLKKVVYK
jgi:asparagine synthase (glutamine-hydrolysing)